MHMSEETQTPQLEKPETTPEATSDAAMDEHWKDIDVMNRASQAAKANFIDVPTPSEDPKGWSRGKTIGATIALASAAALGAGGATVVVDSIVPGQEVASATSTVFNGEGIQQSVDRDIQQIESQKIDPADTTERQDVISQAVDMHTDSNGIVQPGENVTVIAEKSPILGNITYKAVPNEASQPVVNEQLPLPPALNTDGTIPAPDTH
jgi:hypothetical protein